MTYMEDDLDREILRLLQKNAKITCEEIGKILNRSPSTVRDRIKRLEEMRIILGYAAIVDYERLGIMADAIIAADIDPTSYPAAVSSLFSIENVIEILSVSGERRVMIRMRARDNRELADLIEKKIKPLGFRNIETIVVLKPIVRYPGL